MRGLLPGTLALLAALLSGCFWVWEMHDGSRMDPDAEVAFPFALLGILLIVGAVLVAMNLSSPPVQPKAPPPPPPAAPPAPPPTAAPAEDVQEPAPAAAPRAAKARRRQP